jgi:ribosome-interacting GTPase 1
MRWSTVVDNQYNEIVGYLKEARIDLENAEDAIIDRIKKIRVYLDKNLDKEQFEEYQFLKNTLEDIEEIIEEIEDIILDLQS